MLKWLRAQLGPTRVERPRVAEPPPRRALTRRTFSGPYLLLHTYLDRRFADTIVLTFAQIEDLIGFALPAAALAHTEWWTDPSDDDLLAPHHTDSWRLARRTAQPNLAAKIVSFERDL
jgi:hypothetical protein